MYNEEEQRVADLAVVAYRKQKERVKNIIKKLENKKFKYGDIVIKDSISPLDISMGVTEAVGKIVGYDEQYGYYRVFYSKGNPYIGEYEHDIRLYDGDDVTDEVKDYCLMNLKEIRVFL